MTSASPEAYPISQLSKCASHCVCEVGLYLKIYISIIGPEFIAGVVRYWINAVGAKTAYMKPVSPWKNSCVFTGPIYVCIKIYGARGRIECNKSNKVYLRIIGI